MRNQRPWILALAAALALTAGCKKDESSAQAPSSDPAKQPGVKPGPAGTLSEEERAAALKTRAEAMHKRLDTDGDGKLTPAELGAARGRMRFDDPAALDTNHDGDISADELVAAMKARSDQRRAQRAGSGGAAGSGGGDGEGSGSGAAGGW